MDRGAWWAAVHESDTTELLHFHFSLSCIGEGNGNPVQCSCLENPRDGGAWWAAVYGVAQSWIWLKRLSSSSSSSVYMWIPASYFIPPPTSLFLLLTISFFSVVCKSLFVLEISSFVLFFFFYIPHTSDIIWYLFFPVWLTPLSMIISLGPSMLLQMTLFHFLMAE